MTPSELDTARKEIQEADRGIAPLFEKRMHAVRSVAAYKKERGLPILDEEQEKRILENHMAYLDDPELRPYYRTFLKDTMKVSKQFQEDLIHGSEDASSVNGAGKVLHIRTGTGNYDVVISSGCLARAGDLLDLDRKVLIVTDSGVPERYAQILAEFCREPVIAVIGQGEVNKSLQNFGMLLETMMGHGFTRKDCVAAVGGGVCGDLAGFAAASYMRGIDFYNIPTTVLSQVDSSIGGKTAINLGSIKNVAGAFYQPRKVLVDTQTLETLNKHQISAGLAEALKMSVTFDEELFRIFEREDIRGNIDRIIERSLRIKGDVVEQDEKESGLRKVLNFGHTIGHGIESQCLDGSLYHGECVAVGMLPMCSPQVRERLLPILEKLELPTSVELDPDKVCDAVMHDKKAADGVITIIETDRIGTWKMRKADKALIRERTAMVVKGGK